MRILRVAFLSSVALDLAAALAMIVLAIHYFYALRHGGDGLSGGALPAELGSALIVLLLTPEFSRRCERSRPLTRIVCMRPVRAESLLDLPPLPEPAPAREIRTVSAQGVTVAFDRVSLTWDPARGPALDGLSFRIRPGKRLSWPVHLVPANRR